MPGEFKWPPCMETPQTSFPSYQSRVGVVALVIRSLRAAPFIYFKVRSWSTGKSENGQCNCKLLLVSWGCLIILIQENWKLFDTSFSPKNQHVTAALWNLKIKEINLSPSTMSSARIFFSRSLPNNGYWPSYPVLMLCNFFVLFLPNIYQLIEIHVIS